jgi:DNA repair protein RecN (Recombination protein N)
VIRAGAEKATISAVFEAEGGAEKTVARILENNGIDANQEDDSVILRREISAGGKGRVFVNNQPATVAVLRQLAPHLATIHAQNESLLSFDASTRLRLLDSFANVQLDPTAEAFSKWKNINSRIEELHRDEQDRLRLLDLPDEEGVRADLAAVLEPMTALGFGDRPQGCQEKERQQRNDAPCGRHDGNAHGGEGLLELGNP